MKFKIIFLLFNIVVLISFAIIFFMPLAMLGWDYTKEFWSQNWYLPLIFAAILAVLNTYFIMNWRLFRLLEQENWSGVADYLEKRAEEGKIRSQQIRLLVNAYLVSGNSSRISYLREQLDKSNPKLLKKNALVLGISYVVDNDPQGMEAYYQQHLEYEGNDRYWILWFYGFSLTLQKRRDEAALQLRESAEKGKDPLVRLLSAYLLQASEEEIEAADQVKRELREKYPREKWEREIEKERENIQVVLLMSLINEAVDWLFDGESAVKQ